MMRKFVDKTVTPRLKDELKKKSAGMGEKTLTPRLREELKKKGIPDSNITMGRAKRGIYAGRHIQFGNQISEDGGNKFVTFFISSYFFFSILILSRNCNSALILILISYHDKVNSKNGRQCV